MIDTDEYEGHTPGPWKALFNHPQVEGSCVVNDEDESNFGYTHGERILGPLWVGELTADMPDTKLIADAPLLLAEVKRLQTIMHEIEAHNGVSAEVIAASSDALFMNDLLTEVKQLRERLIRAYDWAENAVNGNDSAMMDYTEYVCGGDEE